MIDLTRYVHAGAAVWWGQAGAEPVALVDALLDQVVSIGPIRAFSGLTWNARLTRDLPEEITMLSYGALGRLRELSKAGLLGVVPCHYAALPRLFAERALPCDVGLVQVAPPDADGVCSLGVGADYMADAIQHTPVLLGEINAQMPVTRGAPRIPLDRFAATVRTDRPLLAAPERAPDEIDQAIAQNVAALVSDGNTIQVGVGTLPSAVLEALGGHRDIGIHSGLVSDGVVRLVDAGVATGARKEIDPGVVVTGSAMGSREFYAKLPDLPVELRPTSYTHAPETLSRLRSLVSINSAVEVDLTGQVGAETRGGVYVGAVGGQVDFSRAASLTGTRSIIALRASSGERSTIKVALTEGSVTTGRVDVDVVVTEHGAAHLRGCTLAERARRLVNIAAPEYREELARRARMYGRTAV